MRIECLTAPSAFLWPRRGREAGVLGGEVGVFGADRRPARLLRASQSSHLDPLRVLPERRLPADWSLPGHCPAQVARCLSVGKTRHVGADLGDDHLGGAPLNAGDRAEQLNGRRERGDLLLDRVGEPRRSARRGSRCGRGSRRSRRACMMVEAALERLLQRGDLRAQPALGELGEYLGVGRALRRARRASPGPDLPRMSVATQSSLIPVSSSALCSRLASRWRSWICVLRYRVRFRSVRIGFGGTKLALQQPGLRELAQPRGVLDVGLAARDLLDVARVDQQAARTRPRGSPTPASSTRRSPPS